MRTWRSAVAKVLLCAAVAALGAGAARGDGKAVYGWDLPPETYRDNAPPNPRIQMVWKSPREKTPALWSSSLDGKDVRRVVSEEVLFSGEAKHIALTPVRSPDGRYIACSGFTQDEEQIRFLVDRKTQTVKTMMKDSAGEPSFFWSADSKHVYFYGNGEVWNYDVATGSLTKLPPMLAARLLLVDGEKRFMGVSATQIQYWDRAGKLVSKKKLPFDRGLVVAVSRTGMRVLVLPSLSGVFLVDSAHPERKPVAVAHVAGNAVFGPDEQAIYYGGGDEQTGEGALLRLDPDGKVSNLGLFPGAIMGNVTLTER